MILGPPPPIGFSSSLIKLEYHVNLGLFASALVRDLSRAYNPKYFLAFALTYLFPLRPLTAECLSGRLAGSVCVNMSTYRKPLAFKQNTGYTTRGHGRGRGHKGRRRGEGRRR